MLIKHKMIANTSVAVVSMGIILYLLVYSLNSLEGDIDLALNIGEIEVSILQERRNEKDFMSRKDLKYHEKFETTMVALKQQVNILNQTFLDKGEDVADIQLLQQALLDYQTHFNRYVRAQQKIGLHAKDGLYGNLRAAVHGVESLIGDNDYKLLSTMLQLRRNEKDFLLRLDDKYVDKWQKNFEKFNQQIDESDIDSSLKTDIRDNLIIYQTGFVALADAQRSLGYKANQGITGEMRASVHSVDDVLERLYKKSQQLVIEHKEFTHNTALLIFALVAAVMLVITFLFSKRILNSIKTINVAVRKIEKDNDLSVLVDASSQDEIGDMAKVFNSMISSFRNVIHQVNESASTVNSATQSLTENIHISNDGVDTQIQQTDMVATAVTEMVATVDAIATTTQEAAHKAEATNANAEKGQKGVAQTIERIDILSQKLIESENVAQELAKDSHTIGTVLDVIRGIAEQTNLLALNAAIEAARAGEQGRGFAVVADEVRTLASRTQDSTQEIEGIINSLQDRTKSIVEHMSTCRTQGEESASQASSAGEMLSEIASDVSTIMDMNTSIATAIHQQSTVASEMNEHVILIRDVAEQSGQSASHNAQMSEELTQQAQVLTTEVNKFKV